MRRLGRSPHRAAPRWVLEETTPADVASKKLPDHVRALVADQDAWEVRT